MRFSGVSIFCLCLIAWLRVVPVGAAATFAGVSEGRFVNPVGPAEMVLDGVGTDQLDWGRLRPGSETPNRFRFEAREFSAGENVPVVVGVFEYSNGEAAVGTVPTSVDLELDLPLGDDVARSFVFPLIIGATTNNGNNETSADTVSLGRRAASELIVMGEDRFVLALEFGKTSENGFSLGDEFSVFEKSAATTELVVTFQPANVVSGRAAGFFDNAVGQGALITDGQGTDTFSWGEPPPGADPNRFQIRGIDFEGVTGHPFSIGLFEYFNGSVRTGTAADTLDLFLLLELPGSAIRTLRFPLTIISTPNTADREASADVVQIARPVSDRRIEIHGQEFEVELSFGGAGEGGFTESDRFFVFEDVTETAVLELKLTGMLPEPKPDLALTIKTAVEVEFQTFPGGRYQIQSSLDLENWVDEGDTVLGTGRKHREFFSVPVDSSRVFRVIEPTAEN